MGRPTPPYGPRHARGESLQRVIHFRNTPIIRILLSLMEEMSNVANNYRRVNPEFQRHQMSTSASLQSLFRHLPDSRTDSMTNKCLTISENHKSVWPLFRPKYLSAAGRGEAYSRYKRTLIWLCTSNLIYIRSLGTETLIRYIPIPVTSDDLK